MAHSRAAELHRDQGRKPGFDRHQLHIMRDILAQDASPTIIAEAAGASREVVYYVQDDPANAEARLAVHVVAHAMGILAAEKQGRAGGPARKLWATRL